MSTRCNIVIKENGIVKIWLYHHTDGYIEGIGHALVKILKDMSYDFSIYNWDSIATEIVKNKEWDFEITSKQHGDIDYLYTISIVGKTENHIRDIDTFRTYLNVINVYSEESKLLAKYSEQYGFIDYCETDQGVEE